MEFMYTYKRLDNLCRDINGIGVTGYIEDMERTTNGSYSVSSWKEDYLNLKKYRHIRNLIAHEADANERNMCSEQDALWLNDFYQRILTQNDPLALYRQHAAQSRSTVHNTKPKPYSYSSKPSSTPKKKNFLPGCLVSISILLAISIFCMLLFLFYNNEIANT